MTITTNDTRDEYTSTAGQVLFSYTFKIFESTDLNVYVTPAGQDPDDTTDIVTGYSVTDVGEEDGGTITLVTPTTAGDSVTIVSDIPESRTTDYQNNGDFLPDTVNDDFDRVVSLVKQANDKVNRTVSFQESEQGVSNLELPAPEALKGLRWKADLSGLENIDLDTGASDPPTIRQTLTGDVTFTDNGGGKVILILNPGTADRNVNPSGSFADGFEAVVINNGPTSSYKLLFFDSTDLNNPVSPGDKAQSFTYLLTEDKWI